MQRKTKSLLCASLKILTHSLEAHMYKMQELHPYISMENSDR